MFGIFFAILCAFGLWALWSPRRYRGYHGYGYGCGCGKWAAQQQGAQQSQQTQPGGASAPSGTTTANA